LGPILSVFLLICLFTVSCRDSLQEDIEKTQQMYREQPKMLKILALGDSYTHRRSRGSTYRKLADATCRTTS